MFSKRDLKKMLSNYIIYLLAWTDFDDNEVKPSHCDIGTPNIQLIYTMFIDSVMALLSSYCIAGAAFNKFVGGKEGKEIIPHYGLMASGAGQMKARFLFLLRSIL